MDIIVWDVGHGNAASVRLPNGTVILLDCGPTPGAGSSPALATLRHWGRIDALIISHPDMDHIGDIRSAAFARPPFLVAPQVPPAQILEDKNEADRHAALSYLSFKDRYRPFLGRMPFGNTRVEWFSVGGQHGTMNAYSTVTFIQHGWFTFLYAGDLPARCWADLLDAHGARLFPLLDQTNFFVIPHHGRRDPHSPDLMRLMGNLKLGIVSDGGAKPTSATSEYEHYFEGWPVCNTQTLRCRRRRILTTRKDGFVRLRAIFDAGICRAVLAAVGGRHG